MLDQYAQRISSLESLSPSIVIFTLLLTSLLAAGIAFTCKLTYPKEHFPRQLFKQIILSSTISALVIMLAGETVALGLVLLGAAIMFTFKDQVQGPRDALFIFASIVMGIATGVFSYTIAISGTVLFCYVVVLLYYPPAESNHS
jgi:uncharacterized membrane protein YhiD involved in acid resistance